MSVKAKDIMTRELITVDKDLRVSDLIELFVKHKISCAPVVDKKGKLAGIVTKTDIIGHFMDLDLDLTVKMGLKDLMDTTPDLENLSIATETQLTVGNIMSPDPVTGKESMPVKELARTMIENRIHRLIIMKGKKMTGIVSTIDLISHLAGKK